MYFFESLFRIPPECVRRVALGCWLFNQGVEGGRERVKRSGSYSYLVPLPSVRAQKHKSGPRSRTIRRRRRRRRWKPLRRCCGSDLMSALFDICLSYCVMVNSSMLDAVVFIYIVPLWGLVSFTECEFISTRITDSCRHRARNPKTHHIIWYNKWNNDLIFDGAWRKDCAFAPYLG